MTLRPGFLLTTAFVLTSPAAEAQLQSLPVYPISVLHRGTSVAVDYGRDVDPSRVTAQHLGIRAMVQPGPVSLEFGAGLRDAGADPDLQAAASTGVRLVGGGASRLTLGLQVGAGYLRSGKADSAATHLALPLGLGVAFPERTAGAAGLRPWLAPRVQLNRVSFAGVILNHVGLGAAAGVDVALPGRAGIHLSVDWSRFPDRRSGGVTFLGGSRLTIGAGVYVSFGTRTPVP